MVTVRDISCKKLSWQMYKVESIAIYPVWIIKRLESRGFGSTLMHLLSIWCLITLLSVSKSKPIILLSPEITVFLCLIPATPITAEVWIVLWSTLGFQQFSAFSLQWTTTWSFPPVMKEFPSHGINITLLIVPLTCGLCSKKVTWFVIHYVTGINKIKYWNRIMMEDSF